MSAINYFNDANEFIVAYYTTMIYSPSDLPKFYDDSALIIRPPTNDPKSIHEIHNSLSLILHSGSSVNIISKNILPSNDYLAISIIGSIMSNGMEKYFTQMFVLQDKFNRLYVTSDSLQYIDSYRPESNFLVRKGEHEKAAF